MVIAALLPIHALFAHSATHGIRKIALSHGTRAVGRLKPRWWRRGALIAVILSAGAYVQHRFALVQHIFLRLNISRKLGLGFGILILLSVMGSVFVFDQTRRMKDVQQGNATSDKIVDLLDQIHMDSEFSRAAVRDLLVSKRSEDRARANHFVEEGRTDVGQARALIAEQAEDLLPAFDRYIDSRQLYDTHFTAVYLGMIEKGQIANVTASIRGGYDRSQRDQAEHDFVQLQRQADIWSKQWDDKSEDAINETVIVVIAVGLLSAVLGGALAWLFARAIAMPLTKMTDVMRTIAQGNLDVKVPSQEQSDEIGEMARAVCVFRDAALEKAALEQRAAQVATAIERERTSNETQRTVRMKEQAHVFSQLANGLSRLATGDLAQRFEATFPDDFEGVRRDFNEAIEHLHTAMQHVVESTLEIEQVAQTISRTSDDLDGRAKRQALTLQTTSATLNDITSSIEVTASGVAQARSTFAQARGDAERSHELIARAMKTMAVIDQASKRISAFTDSIDVIASQTNLLALNATVEAARAGQAGKGFAVVASEVSALAKKSADAVREIKALTVTSVNQVEDGVALVGNMGESFGRIVHHVIAIDEIADHIATASSQQSSALTEVNASLRTIDGDTRETADLIGAAASRARGLSHQAHSLSGLMAKFQL